MRYFLAVLLILANVAVCAAAPYTTIQLRRDTPANWTAYNPVLAAGETGCEMTGSPLRCTAQKVGDGVTHWLSLPYTSQAKTTGVGPDVQTALDGKADKTSVGALSVQSAINGQPGAKGDYDPITNTASNDTAAFQRAADFVCSATPSNRIVFVPAGDYRITSPIRINCREVKFVGVGFAEGSGSIRNGSTLWGDFAGSAGTLAGVFEIGDTVAPAYWPTMSYADTAEGAAFEHLRFTTPDATRDADFTNGKTVKYRQRLAGIVDWGSGSVMIKECEFDGLDRGFFGLHSDISQVNTSYFSYNHVAVDLRYRCDQFTWIGGHSRVNDTLLRVVQSGVMTIVNMSGDNNGSPTDPPVYIEGPTSNHINFIGGWFEQNLGGYAGTIPAFVRVEGKVENLTFYNPFIMSKTANLGAGHVQYFLSIGNGDSKIAVYGATTQSVDAAGLEKFMRFYGTGSPIVSINGLVTDFDNKFMLIDAGATIAPFITYDVIDDYNHWHRSGTYGNTSDNSLMNEHRSTSDTPTLAQFIGHRTTDDKYQRLKVTGDIPNATITLFNVDNPTNAASGDTKNFIFGGVNGTWNGGHTVFGTTHLWVDSSSRLRVKSGAPTSETDGVGMMVGPATGSGAPGTTPVYVGQEYCDTAAKKWYKAAGTASSADWIVLN